MALKGHFGGGSWHAWPRDIRVREPGALAYYRGQVGEWATYHEYVQWLFADQWRALKQHANGLGIQIIGDIPIFVAEDSADVWARPDQFQLDDEGSPTVIAGVPPDNFSATGQRWGNPHYRWDRMAQDGYRWWIERIRADSGGGRHRAHRPFPRLRGALGGPGGRADRGRTGSG